MYLATTDTVARFVQWVDGHPDVAYPAFALAYIVATVAFLPGLILTLAAGYLFGVIEGVIVVSVASTLGATAAFIVGRTLARQWVAGQIAGRPRFQALDRAIRAKGFTVVFLTRLSPIFPYNLLNYAYGITAVGLGPYMLATWIGMLPATLMYVYLGSAAQTLGAVLDGEVQSGQLGTWLFFIGLAATIAVAVLVTRYATRALREELRSREPEAANAAQSPDAPHE